MVDPDKRIVGFAKHGNKAAFGKLVRKYRDPILTLVYDYVHDYDLAKDIAQEVFIKAFRHIREFEERSLFSSWLYRIAVNSALDALKNKKRLKTKPIEAMEDLPAHSDKEDGKLSYDDNLTNAINNLSKNQRTAIVLRYFHHQSVHEIAELLECAESTVRIHLHRALRKLQKDLKKTD